MQKNLTRNNRKAIPTLPFSLYPKLEYNDFAYFRKLISDECGICLSDNKAMLVQNRVGKRLRALGLKSFKDYQTYLSTRVGHQTEQQEFWSALTTNETHFFREMHHFDALKSLVLPEIVSQNRKQKTIRIWSAACSTGQEVYTLAMVLDDFLRYHPCWNYEILGTDLDIHALQVAKKATYPLNFLDEIPPLYQRYVDIDQDQFQIRADLRNHAVFQQKNFAEATAQRPLVDLIMCRNAIMYLEKVIRWRLVQSFHQSLLPGGLLIVGTSESLHSMPKLFVTQRAQKTLFYVKSVSS